MSLLWTTAIAQQPDYFHGTIRALNPGDIISPAENRPAHQTTFPSVTDAGHSYATPNEDHAWDYAEKAHNKHFQPGMKTHPRVYKVRPLHPTVEKDPQWDDEHNISRGNWSEDVRSPHGFEVVHEMPMPEHMGEPEDWR